MAKKVVKQDKTVGQQFFVLGSDFGDGDPVTLYRTLNELVTNYEPAEDDPITVFEVKKVGRVVTTVEGVF